LLDFRNWLGLETQVVDPASNHRKSRDYKAQRASLYKLIGSMPSGFAARSPGCVYSASLLSLYFSNLVSCYDMSAISNTNNPRGEKPLPAN
jgi:hypothetical protein